MTSGEQLIIELGLSKFKNITIEKAIAYTPSIFIITVDSRHDGRPITTSMVRKIDTSVMYKVNGGSGIDLEKIKFTPVIPLEDYDGTVHTRGLILFRDLAGEFYAKGSMYESLKVIEDNRIRD